MSHVIGEFLGTEKFKEIVSAIENNSNAGFIAGMCFAQTLAMAKCRTYLYHVDKLSKEEGGSAETLQYKCQGGDAK